MKSILKLRSLLLAFLPGFALLTTTLDTSAASATPPELMTYQGYLVDVNGAPLAPSAPANYPIVFRIYDASTGGNILWAEQQIVTVDKGNFSVVLGEGTAVSGEDRPALSSAFTGANSSDRFLGITVTISGTTMTLSPRLRLLPAPYAFAATTAGALVNSAGVSLVSSSGANVGIGTTSPSAMLQIGEGANVGPGGLKINTGWLNTSNFSENRPLDVQVRGDSKLVVNTQGYVGIGTSTPSSSLEVSNGSVGIGIKPGQYFNGSTWLNDNNWVNLDIPGFKNLNISDNLIVTGGNVGIGTVNPQRALHVAGDISISDRTLFFRGGTDPNHGIGWRGTGNTFAGQNPDGPVLFGHGGGILGTTAGGARAVLNWRSDGRVGIGTSDPHAPLHVIGAVNHSWAYGFLNRNGAGATSGNVTTPLSIIADNRIGAAEFNAFSDARTKSILGLSDNRLDLEMIRKLRVTDYGMVDQVAHGDARKKGFIAQEVETVIPEAVTSSVQFVPDIYAFPSSFQSDEQRQTIAVTLSKPHGLKIGDRVRIIADDLQLELSVTDVPSAAEFVAGKIEKAPKEVFVYGKQVPDFRTLNYDRIFTTGIGAIQELARRTEALEKSEARIAELEQKTARVAELEKKAAKVDLLEEQVAKLQKLVADLASAAGKASEPVAASPRGPATTIASANK